VALFRRNSDGIILAKIWRLSVGCVTHEASGSPQIIIDRYMDELGMITAIGAGSMGAGGQLPPLEFFSPSPWTIFAPLPLVLESNY